MLQLLVDDHLVAEQVTVPATEQVELIAVAKQFDTDRQMRIGNFGPISLDRATVAKAVMGMLRDGIDDAVRFGSADQLAIERLCAPESARTDFLSEGFR